ncbi:MAG: VWA domain-containing protein [Pirellula sp.]|jgi:hypothetical protein|nr:VWA domain-containing protein [Pirellula sp.]
MNINRFGWLSGWTVATIAVFLCAPYGRAMQESSAVSPVVVIVLDDSGSMRDKMRTDQGKEPRMQVAQRALKKLVEQLPDNTQLGLLLMNGARNERGWLVPLGPIEKGKTIALIDQVRADGGTPLGQSMKTAMEQLLVARTSKPIGDYRLIVVTDGEATDSNVLNEFLPEIVARGIVVDAIGVDMKNDHTLASKAHTYRRANDAASFESALVEIFAESSQSQLGDSGASDFDLIAGLPNEFASEALAALSSMTNKPIEATAESRDSTFFPSSSSGSGVAASKPKSGGNFWFVVAIVVFISIFLNGMLKSQKKR